MWLVILPGPNYGHFVFIRDRETSATAWSCLAMRPPSARAPRRVNL
jgi:hypothetical protein